MARRARACVGRSGSSPPACAQTFDGKYIRGNIFASETSVPNVSLPNTEKDVSAERVDVAKRMTR
jgi:hypothetical protein